MINVMNFESGYRAVIKYDADIELFRGEFIDLNGGADFYAPDVEGLKREGETSLRVFLSSCKERGIEPRKSFSGKFNVRIPPELHAKIATNAAASGTSINQWVSDTLANASH